LTSWLRRTALAERALSITSTGLLQFFKLPAEVAIATSGQMGIAQGPFSMSLSLQMRNRRSFASAFFLFLLLAFIPSSSGSQDQNQNPPATDAQNHSQKGKTVYVCACLKTKSCFCMTEAKMEGPCACGTEGGPPLKPVPADSDWAKQNREALAK